MFCCPRGESTSRFQSLQGDVFQQSYTSGYEGIQQGDGHIGRRFVYFVRPAHSFFHKADGGFVFGKSQLKTAIGVDMAVGHMMDQLLYCPAAFAIRSCQLRLVEFSIAFSQRLRRALSMSQPMPSFGFRTTVCGYIFRWDSVSPSFNYFKF